MARGPDATMTPRVLYDCHIENKKKGVKLEVLAEKHGVTVSSLKSKLSRWRKAGGVDAHEKSLLSVQTNKPSTQKRKVDSKPSTPTTQRVTLPQSEVDKIVNHVQAEVDSKLATLLAKVDSKPSTSGTLDPDLVDEIAQLRSQVYWLERKLKKATTRRISNPAQDRRGMIRKVLIDSGKPMTYAEIAEVLEVKPHVVKGCVNVMPEGMVKKEISDRRGARGGRMVMVSLGE